VTLSQKLTQAPNRDRVVKECCSLIDGEVKIKGGLSGIAVKGAYGLVKTVKPKFVPEVVDAMLDEWVEKLEPHYAAWSADKGGKDFGTYLTDRRAEVSEQLLAVVDGRAQNAKNKTVKNMYTKMRPSAKKHVEEAIPRLGSLVEREMSAPDGA
jgi:hypothetical protein